MAASTSASSSSVIVEEISFPKITAPNAHELLKGLDKVIQLIETIVTNDEHTEAEAKRAVSLDMQRAVSVVDPSNKFTKKIQVAGDGFIFRGRLEAAGRYGFGRMTWITTTMPVTIERGYFKFSQGVSGMTIGSVKLHGIGKIEHGGRMLLADFWHEGNLESSPSGSSMDTIVSSGLRKGFFETNTGIYFGPFSNTMTAGYGTLVFKNHRIFQEFHGHFAGGRFHGPGIMITCDGKISGHWDQGKLSYATITLNDKSFYEGPIKVRVYVPHGKGKYTKPGQYTLEAEWREGKIVGSGCCTYSEKIDPRKQYNGQCTGDGLPDGYGVMHYRDGKIESGLWKRGVFVGRPEIKGQGTARTAETTEKGQQRL